MTVTSLTILCSLYSTAHIPSSMMHMPLERVSSPRPQNASEPHRYVGLLHDPFVAFPTHRSSPHRCPHVPLEAVSVGAKVLRRFFIEWIRGIGFEKQELNASDISNRLLRLAGRDISSILVGQQSRHLDSTPASSPPVRCSNTHYPPDRCSDGISFAYI